MAIGANLSKRDQILISVAVITLGLEAVLRTIGWLPKARSRFEQNLSGLSRRAAAELK